MFNYKKKSDWKFFINSDEISWDFWPFEWIYVKNSLLWDFPVNFDLSKYPWYKFSAWKKWKYIFLISKNWLEDIFKI